MAKAGKKIRLQPEGGSGAIRGQIVRDERGAVLIEAAFALSLLLVVLVGIVTYGMWFMAANSLQQIANEAARSTLGSMSPAERERLVARSLAGSLLNTGVIERDLVTVRTWMEGDFYTVALEYDASGNAIFSRALLPMPDDVIVRSATIDTGGN